MNPADKARALQVPCPLCKVPADIECANVIDGASPREQPHHNRVVRARIVANAIAHNLALEENPS